MSRFELLLTCIRSGQLSEAQIADEMRDPVFAAYVRQRTKSTGGPTPSQRLL